ncbi:MAG: ABC transporter permease [Phycisphaerae bacterium]
MGKILTLARREMAGYFFSPMAYVIGAVFLLASALWFFHAIFVPGNEASLRPLFEAMAYIMVFAVPLLTMRLISEEYRSGTIETLMTVPVTDAQVILGKFVGVMGFYIALLASTIVFLALISIYGQPDGGVAAMGYLGMLLLGAAFVSVGIFTSTLTRYQIVAAIVAIAILAVFGILMQLISLYGQQPWTDLAGYLNAMTYFKDFARGVFDSRGLAFFLTATGLFLFLSVKTLESRRWR